MPVPMRRSRPKAPHTTLFISPFTLSTAFKNLSVKMNLQNIFYRITYSKNNHPQKPGGFSGAPTITPKSLRLFGGPEKNSPPTFRIAVKKRKRHTVPRKCFCTSENTKYGYSVRLIDLSFCLRDYGLNPLPLRHSLLANFSRLLSVNSLRLKDTREYYPFGKAYCLISC